MWIGIVALLGIGATTPAGVWVTQDRDAWVRIAPCPGQTAVLCGRVERLLDSAAASAKDEHNPDPSRRHQPVTGLQILSDFKPTAQGWTDGKIYDPEDGRTHTGLTLRLEGKDRLIISKPLGVLKAEVGRQVWTRVAP
ncbi:DUF2147 domain-containing protein [Asticcacaulis sp. DW145]|uniref:DUF2147 domain-containing protein n=1 Tax=Asticcacaulis sp. DW145 TaxID=3095608 RepID=UPI00308C1ECC|nr:DUF2147 domain-containing protein [Asticcacaulis sp. DW145]